jgi:hypothetical protein
MNKSLLSFLALFTTLSSAWATSWKQETVYWVQYHFSDYAFGKPVASVLAHTGILRAAEPRCRGRGFESHSYWESVDDLEMVRTNQHFYAKKKFHATTNPCQAPVVGPLVQYWVSFQDGSQMITQETLVPLTTEPELKANIWEDFIRAVNQIDFQFQDIQDASETSGKMIQWEHAS